MEANTQHVARLLVSTTLAFMASACVTSGITLAPGADQIKITKEPIDVAGCTAVGNADGNNGSGLMINGIRQMQNQTLVAGGNTLLVTSSVFPQKGIAYHCGAAAK